MTGKTYLRPTGFVDAPFGHDGKVARLAGGLQFFASVEIIRDEGTELVPVQEIEARLDAERKQVWQRLTSPRAPLKLGERVVRLDQPQVVGIVNVTPDSFSDAGVNEDAETAIAAGHDMAAAGAAIVDVGGESTRPGAKPVWEGDEAGRVLPVIRRLAVAGTAVSVAVDWKALYQTRKFRKSARYRRAYDEVSSVFLSLGDAFVDEMLASALRALAYAIDLGDGNGARVIPGDVSNRHDFGLDVLRIQSHSSFGRCSKLATTTRPARLQATLPALHQMWHK